MAINCIVASAEIVSPDFYRFPLWRRVFVEQFLGGQLRTWPSEWWGVSPWIGLALYLLVALPVLAGIVRLSREPG